MRSPLLIRSRAYRPQRGWLIGGLVVLGLCLAACAPRSTITLPTVAVLPSATASPQPALIVTALIAQAQPSRTPTEAPSITPSATITETPWPTTTPLPSATPLPSSTPTPLPAATSAGDGVIIAENGVNIRLGPSVDTSTIGSLPHNTVLILHGRNDQADWYEVEAGVIRGWVKGEYVNIWQSDRITQLPVTGSVPPTPIPVIYAGNIQPVSNPNSVPTMSGPIGGSILGAAISPRMVELLRAGRAAGRRANAYSKVGDSLTASQPFMHGFDSGEYQLGSLSNLQETIIWYAGSHNRPSFAAQAGYNSAAVLDPLRADPNACQPNETPLACEYRIHQPALAIIMLGSVDVNDTGLYDINSYKSFLVQIIETSINQQIVPVLTTFPNAPGYHPNESIAYNNVIRELAAQYQLPLIDLRPPATSLPDGGVERDGFHLTHRGDNVIDFNGEQTRYGVTLRNLLTLQMLDTLRRALP